MNPVNQQKKKNPIKDQLFIVNKPAGKLRLILIMLLFLIYWTIVAQTKIAPLAITENFLALIPTPTNFTSGILRDIILRYFSPSTIIFTVTPLIIFLSVKKMISRYLHSLFPSTGLKETEQYLSNCAFSFCNRDFHIHEGVHIEPQINQEHLKFLGGPANINFSPSSTFIIQNINNRGFLLISSNYPGNTENFPLSHGDIIYAVIPKSNRQMLLKNLKIQDKYQRTTNINLINLLFFFNKSQKISAAFISRKISVHDARFLSYLGYASRNIIHHFLHDETQNFLNNNTSMIFNDKSIPSSINHVHEKILDIAPKKLHKNYAETAPAIIDKSRGVNRKHKHSRYTFLKKISVFSINAKDDEDDCKHLIIELSNHLNEQLKSFFHISTIHISIIEIGKITING